MKKALSFILALTLAFALLPTFALAVDMEIAELKPTEFSVNLCLGDTTGVADGKITNSNCGSAKPKKGTDWQLVNKSGGSTILAPTSGRVRFLPDYLQIIPSAADLSKNYDRLHINFTVPNNGHYDVSFVPYFYTAGGKGQILIDNAVLYEHDFYSETAAAQPDVGLGKNMYFSKGTHRITMKALEVGSGGTYAGVAVQSFTFKPSANQVNPNVTFAATTNVDGHNDITVKTVMRGASVALTAHKEEIPGYEFVGWKRGSNDADSAWIDINGDTYNVWTNTFLTAIYKPTGETAAAKTVDFWNQNGAYMGTATDVEEYNAALNITPSLTGFGDFLGWFTDGNVKLDETTELSNGTTNAVAQYEDGAVSGVTLNGEDVTEADTYNEPISLTETGVTYWMRGGKTIAYGDTYDFNVWAGTAITSHSNVVSDKVPVAILEKNTDYNAYMFEYDDGDYTIVEAGIIFGGTDATVDSCTKKYTSQRKVSHNQFTVPAESGTAKGYIIWKNASGAYQIDYFTE